MPLRWTSEQIIAFAPDAGSAKAGKDLANLRKWVTLGHNEHAAWGECQGSGKLPYQTEIDLSEPAFKCSCPSRKFPCKHGLGLFLLLEAQPAAFTQNEPPAWVSEWLESRVKRVEKTQERASTEKAKSADPAAQAKRARSREAKVGAGLQELELWLRDLIRGGLATTQAQPYSFWEGPAARMVDAQAPGLARLLREMAGVDAGGAGWQEELLGRLGRLHLLIEGFKRLDELAPATQADIRSLIGWTQSQEELLSGNTSVIQRDHWLVLGQRVEEEERLRVQRTWMWGRDCGQAALILNFAHGGAPLETTLRPGAGIDAEVVFYPGSVPLRAVIKQRFGPPQPLGAPLPGSTIGVASQLYAAAQAANPWLEALPVALQDVLVVADGDRWKLRDADSHELPLPSHYEQGWHLLALSGGRAISVFGEWDGKRLLPFGACAGPKWIGL